MRGIGGQDARRGRRARIGLLLALGAGGAAFPGNGLGAEPALIFAGAGSHLAPMRILVDAFTRTHPGVRIEVPSSIGSTGAVRAAAAGAIAMGLLSRPIRSDEKGLGLTVLPYARTVIVIGAHPTVGDETITGRELVQIYRKVKQRWRDGHDIVVLTREPGDSTIEVLGQEVPGFKVAYLESYEAKRWTILYTDQEMSRVLARTPQAIGFSDLGAMTVGRLPIKALPLDGVAPTVQDAMSGRYRLVKKLDFVYKEPLHPDAKAFVEFARSGAGRQALQAGGFLPGE